MNSKNIVEAPNYGKITLKEKILKRPRYEFIKLIEGTFFQFRAYRSFWNYYFSKNKEVKIESFKNEDFYLTQLPNYGAGIGHQLSNWNSGLYFSLKFCIKFAHSPFSSKKWETLLGFGQNEVLASSILATREYKKIRLPRFESNDYHQIDLLKSIIGSYCGKKVIFLLEMDQGYHQQFETHEILSEKFFNAKARINEKLLYDKTTFNIAIHIRRQMEIESDAVWADRGLNNSYYFNVLNEILKKVKSDVKIYLFSQGLETDFPEFKKIKNLVFCLDMDPYLTFSHMVFADLLVSSKSSFSYKPALISKGIKICPKTFWHEYPETDDYILAANDGFFDTNKLSFF